MPKSLIIAFDEIAQFNDLKWEMTIQRISSKITDSHCHPSIPIRNKKNLN